MFSASSRPRTWKATPMHGMVDDSDDSEEKVEWKHGPPELPGLMAASIWMASKLLLQQTSEWASGKTKVQDNLVTYANLQQDWQHIQASTLLPQAKRAMESKASPRLAAMLTSTPFKHIMLNFFIISQQLLGMRSARFKRVVGSPHYCFAWFLCEAWRKQGTLYRCMSILLTTPTVTHALSPPMG